MRKAPPPELFSGQYGLQFVEESVRNDHLEAAPRPEDKQLVRRPLGDGRAHEDAGVEYGANYRSAFRSRLMA